MENMIFCQSCGMPLTKPEEHGTNNDGSQNDDYCVYCYKDGQFLSNETMEEMVESCIPHVSNGNPYPDAETARKAMLEYFPKLKRWSGAVN